MWSCPTCEYINEAIDESCPRCGTLRISDGHDQPAGLQNRESDAASAIGTDTATSQTSQRPSHAPTSKRALGISLIAISLLLFTAALWVSLQRGYFKLPSSGREATLPSTALSLSHDEVVSPEAAGREGANTVESRTDSESADQSEDPLLLLTSSQSPPPSECKPFVDQLLNFDTRLAQFNFPHHEPQPLSENELVELDKLNILAEDLSQSYVKFESDAKAWPESSMTTCVDVLRRAYLYRMIGLVRVAGTARAGDSVGKHSAYMIADNLRQSMEEVGELDPAPLQQAWSDALYVHEQSERNAQYGSQLAELAKHYEQLKHVHEDFQAKLEAFPPYEIKNGILGPGAADLLEAYDAMMSSIEQADSEFQAYVDILDPDTMSDRMENIVKDFTKLAQDDHLHCFTQTYVLYSKDRDLSHASYSRLKAHFEYARDHWPRFRDNYVSVYENYESVWDQRWRSEQATPEPR